MMEPRLTLPLALLLLFAGAGAALALGTPDGLPPALETVCDLETGSAYGHCNAYCEAMDCDSGRPHASATACSRVRSKFLQSTGRDLPCEATCPCADPEVSEAFVKLLAGQVPIAVCYAEPYREIEDGVMAFITTTGSSFAGFSYLFEGQWFCGPSNDDGRPLPISPEQGQACARLVEQEANRQGVTCAPPNG